MEGGSIKDVYGCFYKIQTNPIYFVYDADLMIETFKKSAIHEMKNFNKKTSREEESRKAREVNLELGNIQSLFHSSYT